MRRNIFCGLFVLFISVGTAAAQNCPAYPNTLTNGTNADAGQVMANFNSILNCANNSIRILGGGNVGIGNTNPVSLLEVGSHVFAVTNAANGRVQIGTSNANANNTNAADLQITNPADSGVVGMTLNVGDATNNGNIYWRSNTSNSGLQIVGNPGSNYLSFYTSGAERIRIDSSGNVGIGTAGPQYALDVRNGVVAGAGAYVNTSDARLKMNIAPVAYGLDAIMKLRPIGFDWRDQSQAWQKRRQIGLIAQDVETVVPEAVSIANGEMQTRSLAYGALVPVLINAIQDLKAENNNLKAANDNLETRVRALEDATRSGRAALHSTTTDLTRGTVFNVPTPAQQ